MNFFFGGGWGGVWSGLSKSRRDLCTCIWQVSDNTNQLQHQFDTINDGWMLTIVSGLLCFCVIEKCHSKNGALNKILKEPYHPQVQFKILNKICACRMDPILICFVKGILNLFNTSFVRLFAVFVETSMAGCCLFHIIIFRSWIHFKEQEWRISVDFGLILYTQAKCRFFSFNLLFFFLYIHCDNQGYLYSSVLLLIFGEITWNLG